MLRLTLFGRFSIVSTDGAQIPLKSQKAKALLAYLALSPDNTRSREEIRALLWSDRGDTQAGASLRQVLFGLKKTLTHETSAALRISDDAVSLDPEFIAVEPGDGELLSGFHLNDPAFEEWLRDERLRTEDRMLQSTEPEAPMATEKPSIAVLPFTNMSGDPDQEYFSDGITEDIITELSRFREFAVMARNSTFHYKDHSPAADELAHDLAVRYIVQGSVRRFGNRVRVTAQLIDTTSSSQIWAERYDRELEDIFAIQDELTASIVARVDDRIKGVGVALARLRESPKGTAYDLVLQSRPYRTQINPESSARAGKLLEQAIAVDPYCAQAYAGLAFVRSGQYEEGWTTAPERTLREAQTSAELAVRLDRADGYTHASLAYVNYLCGDFDRAMHEASVALDLNPNHVNIIMTMGWISIVAGDPETGILHIERARQLNPNMPGFELWTLGLAYLEARRYQEAIDTLLKVSDPPPDVHLELAVSYAYLGQKDKAQGHTQEFLNRAKNEMSVFPGDDPLAWRTFFELTHKRRRTEDVEHYIAGARIAGLPI